MHSLRSFFDWFRECGGAERPWLILGKGPSFAQRHQHQLGDYHLLSLNHAVREQQVLVAHVIDVDVIRTCEDVLEQNAGIVVMPWRPHVHNKVGDRNLVELAPTIPVLARLAAAGRLVWYDLSTAATRHGPGPVVRATYFSAEAALNLLALAGVRRVRSLGVDGGTVYSADFQDLADQTLLANGHASFDLQFRGIACTILETGVDFAPLDLPCPVRVSLVHAPREALAAVVLEHSIRKRTSIHVQITSSTVGRVRPQDGPALVLSPRLQCFADLRRLWTAMPGEGDLLLPDVIAGSEREGVDRSVVLAVTRATGVTVATLASMMQAGLSTSDLHRFGLRVRQALAPAWQPTRRFVPGHSRFVYFADNGSEPWLSRAHPLGHLWVRDLIDGIASGTISLEQVVAEVRRGHVRASLLYQVEHALEEAVLLPRRARALDRTFRAPDGQRTGGAKPVATIALLCRALARVFYQRTRAYRAVWQAARGVRDEEKGVLFTRP